MPETIYVIISFAILFLRVVSVAMVLRVLLNWFDVGENSKFVRLVYAVTEPAIIPLRTLFYKKNWFQETPIDMSFTFTWLIILIFEMILGQMI